MNKKSCLEDRYSIFNQRLYKVIYLPSRIIGQQVYEHQLSDLAHGLTTLPTFSAERNLLLNGDQTYTRHDQKT